MCVNTLMYECTTFLVQHRSVKIAFKFHRHNFFLSEGKMWRWTRRNIYFSISLKEILSFKHVWQDQSFEELKV